MFDQFVDYRLVFTICDDLWGSIFEMTPYSQNSIFFWNLEIVQYPSEFNLFHSKLPNFFVLISTLQS